MSRLIVAQCGAGVDLFDVVPGVKAGQRLAIVIQQAGAENPGMEDPLLQCRLGIELIGAVCSHGPVLVKHTDILGGGVIAVHGSIAYQETVAVAPVETVGIPIHGQDRSDALAHRIQMFPLTIGVIRSTGEFRLKGAQIRHVDVRHIV